MSADYLDFVRFARPFFAVSTNPAIKPAAMHIATLIGGRPPYTVWASARRKI